MGDPSYPLLVSGRNVWVEVDSMVALMFDASSSTIEELIVGVEELLICCDIEEEGKISPCALMSVVGEIGAGVLNSKAR